jgi:hypothetical protein
MNEYQSRARQSGQLRAPGEHEVSLSEYASYEGCVAAEDREIDTKRSLKITRFSRNRDPLGSVGTPCSSDLGQWAEHKPHYDVQLSDNCDQTRRSAQTVLLSRFGQSRSLAVGRGHCTGKQ